MTSFPFQCPAHPDSNNNEVTYVMQKLFQKRENYQFRSMENKSRKLFLTEGKGSTLVPGNALTAAPDSQETSRRLRRYHNGGLNILFFDGHVERFTGKDEEIAPLLKSGSN